VPQRKVADGGPISRPPRRRSPRGLVEDMDGALEVDATNPDAVEAQTE